MECMGPALELAGHTYLACYKGAEHLPGMYYRSKAYTWHVFWALGVHLMHIGKAGYTVGM